MKSLMKTEKYTLFFKLTALAFLAGTLAACVPEGPEDEPVPDMSMLVRWTINGIEPDALLCRALNPGTVSVELWEDSDCDGNLNDGYYIYRFECEGGLCIRPGGEEHGSACRQDEDCGLGGVCLKGAGRTGNVFFSDTDTCVQLVLVARSDDEDTEDLALAWTADFPTEACNRYCEDGYCYDTYEDCPEDCYCEVDTGGPAYPLTRDPEDMPQCQAGEEGVFPACRDLGAVDFDLSFEEFGPLALDLTWQRDDDTFGTCEEAGVETAGYLLERRYEGEEETVYRTLDEVTADSAAPCPDELSWRLVPFGFYRLVVEGRNATGSVLWQAECEDESGGDLEVDDHDENRFSCLVTRL
jgi:hypothetical protein